MDVIKYLIEVHKCDVMTRDNYNNTPLHIASLCGQPKVVQYLVEEHKFDPNISGFDQRLSLHYACENGHVNVIKYFTDVHKCDVIAIDRSNHKQLHIASLFGQLKVVQYLIEELKVGQNTTGLNQRLPLHYACERGHVNVIKYFIEVHKCDIVGRDSCNDTPLHIASLFGQLKVVQYSIEELKVDPKINSFNQRLPLHCACERGHLKLIKYLIEVHRCDFLAGDYFNKTPLHYASASGELKAVKFLVQKYLLKHNVGDLCLQSKDGYTAEQIALREGHIAISSYLKSETVCRHSYICSLMVLGNSDAGKSTLIKSMISEKSYFGRYFTVKGVTPSTPGIVPCKMKKQGMGQFNIYDFSGHEDYYASHEIILQHTRYPFIVIVFNMSLLFSAIQIQLSFWSSVVSNIKNSSSLNVLLVASHVNQCSNKNNLKKSDSFFSNLIHSSPGIRYHGLVECDCRYSNSQEMTKLISKIAEINKELIIDLIKDTSVYMDTMCFSLISYFRKN